MSTGIDLIFYGIAISSAIASTAISVKAANRPLPAEPRIEDPKSSAQRQRRHALLRAQRAYGLAQTRVGSDTAVGASIARGNEIVGPVPEPSEAY